MSGHGRRNGDSASYPIPLWNGILEHRERIGAAIWEFIWCLDKITLEKDGVGIVLGGQPIKATMIAAQIGKSKRRIRESLEQLEVAGYIRRLRTPAGHVIQVLNSRKFGIWKQVGARAENVHSGGGKRPLTRAENVHSNKDTAVRDAAETQQHDGASKNIEAWKAIGSDLPMGTQAFQVLWAFYAGSKNGAPLSDAMERCIQRAQTKGVRVPKPFYQAKRQIEESEQMDVTAPSDDGIVRLELEGVSA